MKNYFLKFILLSTIFLNTLQANTTKEETIYFGMGCFWGAEKRIAEIKGVINVESGYAGGEDVKVGYYHLLYLEKIIKMGMTDKVNHAEVIKVTYNPSIVSTENLLIAFWENHNPTQGNRQGNDVGTTYRSTIYFTNEAQEKLANETKDNYEKTIKKHGFPAITTEIAKVKNYNKAEDYHQDYLKKNPNGYCGIGGTNIKYDDSLNKTDKSDVYPSLNFERQLIVFEADFCPFCEMFKKDILNNWQSPINVHSTKQIKPPKNWKFKKDLFATPTIVLFEKGEEVSRYTGYTGEKKEFWKWLGFQTLSPEQQQIAFEQGTERAFTGSHLDEKRKGSYVDPITGAVLFRSDAKYKSGTGWPSFFSPIEGAITQHEDTKYGMRRIEIRSASSGIHLGHLFPTIKTKTKKRYCINGNVLKFIPDSESLKK